MKKLERRPDFQKMTEGEVELYLVQYIEQRFSKRGPLIGKLPDQARDDALQEVYIDLWKNRLNYNSDIADFSTYAFNRGRAVIKKIATNHLKTGRIRNKIKNIPNNRPSDNPISVGNDIEIQEQVSLLMGVLNNDEKNVVDMRFFNDESVKNIAKKMKCSDQKIYHMLRSIKDIARNIIEP
jgi:RNA polymerase sigma factor (sigma-70 family)